MTVAAWVLSGSFSFVLEFKDIHVEITHDSESGVNVNVIGCVSLCVRSVLYWVYPASRPMTAGIDSSSHHWK